MPQCLSIMHSPSVQHLDELGAAVIDNLTVPQIFRGDDRHFFLRQCEIPNVNVLHHALDMNRLGNDRYTTLNVPTERRLRSGLIVFFADGNEIGVRENPVLAFRQRSPCLRLHTVILHILECLGLSEERMQLNLIDSGERLDRLTEARATALPTASSFL